ncbi:MAG: hypothetical protein ACI35W_03590 [Anaeroplasmataceae bacterium]
MKFLKRFLIVIGIILIVLIVFIFAFDKRIPIKMVQNQIDARLSYQLKGFDDINNSSDLAVTRTHESTYYVYLNDITNTTNSNYESTFSKTGKDDNILISYSKTPGGNNNTTTYFKEDDKFIISNGTTKQESLEILWKAEIYTSLLLVLPLESDGSLIDCDIFKENITSVKQKGVNISVYSTYENTDYILKYNYFSKRIVEYKIEVTEYDSENRITSRVTDIYKFSKGGK